jgi:hypothetical protein
MIGFRSSSRVASTVTLALLSWLLAPSATSADSLPSGERRLGHNVLEPAYNDLDGSLTYLLTPEASRDGGSERDGAPLYVILYPTAAAGAIGTVSCQHQPMDNCPDHGPALSGLAQSMLPAVYGGGVWGHDHILTAPPGTPRSGGDFSVTWIPVAVLFKDTASAFHHITTLAQLDAAIAAGEVLTIPLPGAALHGSPVAAASYDRATPVPSVPAIP